MRVTIEKLTSEDTFRRACESTLRPGQVSKVSFRNMLRCEHSPVRVVRYLVKLEGVKTFVSVHLVRHKLGVEHFVQSNRDDRGGDEANRHTPINHTMDINAQAMIAVSRKRLCLSSHKETVATWTRVKKAVAEVDADMADFMVPECVYRNGLCPELKCCTVGPGRMVEAYGRWGESAGNGGRDV